MWIEKSFDEFYCVKIFVEKYNLNGGKKYLWEYLSSNLYSLTYKKIELRMFLNS